MIIAVATEGSNVAEHFGHCEAFTMYNTDNSEYSLLRSPEHQPGVLPAFLKQNGADVIISGGMGERARMLFEQLGIKVFVGINMNVKEAIERFQASQLNSNNEFCAPHDPGDGCGQEHGHGRHRLEQGK